MVTNDNFLIKRSLQPEWYTFIKYLKKRFGLGISGRAFDYYGVMNGCLTMIDNVSELNIPIITLYEFYQKPIEVW